MKQTSTFHNMTCALAKCDKTTIRTVYATRLRRTDMKKCPKSAPKKMHTFCKMYKSTNVPQTYLKKSYTNRRDFDVGM